MEEGKQLYMVLRLLETVEVLGTSANFSDCVGVLPVFNNYEEAKKHSKDGKYQIVEVKTLDFFVN